MASAAAQAAADAAHGRAGHGRGSASSGGWQPGQGAPPATTTCFLVEAWNPDRAPQPFTLSFLTAGSASPKAIRYPLSFAPGYSRTGVPVGRHRQAYRPHEALPRSDRAHGRRHAAAGFRPCRFRPHGRPSRCGRAASPRQGQMRRLGSRQHVVARDPGRRRGRRRHADTGGDRGHRRIRPPRNSQFDCL